MADFALTSVGEHMRALVQSAALAPSSHNTQPWQFRIRDGGLDVVADRTRALPVNDPDDRELTISCGCALFNLRVAAGHAGFGASVRLLPDAEDGDLIATVNLTTGGNTASAEAALFPAVARRRTYRKRFDDRAVAPAVLADLAVAARAEGGTLQVLTETQRRAAAALVAEGDAVQWANPSWRRELAAWMHPRRRGDGLTVPGLVVPLAQIVVRSFDMGHGVGAKDQELADASPVLAVLATDGDGPADWIRAGQALERILLAACLYGLQASFLNQPIQVAALRPKLQHLVGAAAFPQLLVRLGYPLSEVPAAARRPLNEIIEDTATPTAGARPRNE